MQENKYVVAVSAPPTLAERPRLTMWQSIVMTAFQIPGQWFKVKRTYSDKSTASSMAREAIRELLSEEEIDNFEFAFQHSMFEEGERYEVFLRYAPLTKPSPRNEVSEPEALAVAEEG